MLAPIVGSAHGSSSLGLCAIVRRNFAASGHVAKWLVPSRSSGACRPAAVRDHAIAAPQPRQRPRLTILDELGRDQPV
jgi:hypothetical protein